MIDTVVDEQAAVMPSAQRTGSMDVEPAVVPPPVSGAFGARKPRENVPRIAIWSIGVILMPPFGVNELPTVW